MAAVAFTGSNLVWQKVDTALANASSAAKWSFQSLKKWMSTYKGNQQLGYYPITATSVDDAGGQVGPTGAFTIYGAWAVKPANTTTDVFLWFLDDVDDDSTLSTKGNAMLAFLGNADTTPTNEAWFVYPNGLVHGLGINIKAYTTPLGTTDSTDTDCPSGFYIVGQ